MSDENRSRESGGMRSASQPDPRNSRNSSPRPGLGGGAPTGLSSAMFGGAGARMPAYKPVTRAAEQAAPASTRNFTPETPFGALDSDPFASDPYNTDPFGLGLLDNDSPFSPSSQSDKREEPQSFAGRGAAAYEAPNYIKDANTADDDAGFDYEEPSEPEPLYYGAGGTHRQPAYDAPANDYYGNAPQSDDYLDDTFTLGNEQNGNGSEDDYLTLSGEQNDAAYGDDAYRNGRDVYANAADLDEPFELSEPAYQASYQDGYRPTSEDEIDEYIARAQRENDDRQAAAPAAAAPRSRSGRGGAVQAFDAGYDQHQRPEIPLSGFSASRAKAPQRRGIEEMSDDETDFDASDAPEGKRKFRLNRGMVMVTSALVGAVVLGGALAYAYRAGNTEVAGQTPVIAADESPVKIAAEDGGAQPAGGAKLIYDRLGGEPEQSGGEQIVPREENVALGNLPPEPQAAPAPEAMNIQGGLVEPALPGASEGVTPMPGAENDPPAQAAADPNGPRRVATYVVRPDGTVVQPEPEAAPADETVAAIPSAPAAAPQEPAQAAIAPSAGGANQFVVQVGARKSQSEALAAFADLQQKHPQLLSGYRPMVQKAELGEKGTWYRLRVGPMAQKTAAAKLCDDLKGQGLPSCLVMNE